MTACKRLWLEKARFVRGGSAIVLALAGSTSLAAQSYTVTPPGFANVSGGRPANLLGAFAAGHFQFADSLLRGKGTKWLREVAYRRAPVHLDPATSGAGKSWRDVQLSIADTDATNLSPVFASNPKSTPVTVFQGALSWPTVQGRPTQDPAPWTYRFPFAAPWLYSGQHDLLLDYRFGGGTLQNGGPWTGATPTYSHAFDAARSATWRQGPVELFGSAQTGCRDSGAASPAYSYLSSWFFARRTGDPRTDDKMLHTIYSRSTARAAPVIHTLSLVGREQGTWFPGVDCNRLHLDPAWTFPAIASSQPLAGATTTLGIVPYTPAVVGERVWAQAAWKDSVTGLLRLSRAGRTTMVAQPGDPYPRYCIYYYDTQGRVGYGPESADYMNPVVRWEYR